MSKSTLLAALTIVSWAIYQAILCLVHAYRLTAGRVVDSRMRYPFLALAIPVLLWLSYQTIILLHHAYRITMGVVIYSWFFLRVQVSAEFFPSYCVGRNGGLDEEHPEMLSDAGYFGYQQCWGRADGNKAAAYLVSRTF